MTRKVKLTRRTLLAGSAALAFGTPIKRAQAETVLRLSLATDVTHPNNIATEAFVKAVAERTNGDLQIKVFPNSVLGSPPEQTEQVVRLGTIDMCILAPSNIDKYSRPFASVMIPYIYDDLDHAHRVIDGPAYDWLKGESEKAGFALIAFNFEFGFRVMCNSKRPIESPADVKGLKIRVPPENQSRTSMEALGATAQVVPFPEVYLALANKVIDGAEQPLSAIYSQKWYEVQNYVSLTNHIYGNQFLIANGKVWQRIKPEWQKIIEEESRKAGKVARQLVTDQERDYIAAMQKIGVKVNSPNLAPFRAAMGPAHASLKSWIGAETWDKWMGFVEQARKKA